MEKNQRWYALSVGDQITNVGSEVMRAIRYKNNKEKSMSFLNIALELLDRTIMDPKNHHRILELVSAKEELIDYFIGENIYNTTEESIIKFYNQFTLDQ